MAFISETGFKIQNGTSDVADLATSWSRVDQGGNRVLTKYDSGENYYFPTVDYGFKNLINGQVITIFNNSLNANITIQSGTASVYLNSNRPVTSFTIGFRRAVMFVHINNNFFTQISGFVPI
jgi:hypothetical protein